MSETTEDDAWVERLRNGLAEASSLSDQVDDDDEVVDLTAAHEPAQPPTLRDPWASTAETSRNDPAPPLRARLRESAELRTDAFAQSTSRLDDEVRALRASVAELTTQMSALRVLALAAPGEVDGESVAWTDVMLLAHELRSRVDDLEQQQRVALRELAEWRADIATLVHELRAGMVDGAT